LRTVQEWRMRAKPSSAIASANTWMLLSVSKLPSLKILMADEKEL
jgi:hypothetical protein